MPSSRTRRVVNRASDALRMAASSLDRSQTALGGFARRMKARLGAAEGIAATAHKLARIVYRLIKHGETHVRKLWRECCQGGEWGDWEAESGPFFISQELV